MVGINKKHELNLKGEYMKFVKKLKKLMVFICETLVSNLMLVVILLFGVSSVFQDYPIFLNTSTIFGILIIISLIVAITIGYLIIVKYYNNISKNELLKRHLTDIYYSTSVLLLFVSADIFNAYTLNQNTSLILKVSIYLILLTILVRTIVLINVLFKTNTGNEL
jgi:hypothetical protein